MSHPLSAATHDAWAQAWHAAPPLARLGHFNDRLWQALGGDASALGRWQLPAPMAVLPSSFRGDEMMVHLQGLVALAAGEVMRRRGGPERGVLIDPVHAALQARSERHLRVDGGPVSELWDPLSGLYACQDGHVRLHMNFPHHRQGILDLLDAAPTRDAVEAALASWPALAVEVEASRRGLVATAWRTDAQWQAHPQADALRDEPVIRLSRVDTGAPASRGLAPWREGQGALHGVRVFELTRIIAGPVAGRTLAAHGADVLHVSAGHLPSLDGLLMDTGRGKRTAQLDLRQASQRGQALSLLESADVFLHGYRPGGAASLGLDDATLMARNPSLVVAELRAYGFSGPWALRRGFDSLTQTATGLNDEERRAFGDARPRAFPAQWLDHGAGYLLALGIQMALARRQEEGGAWKVEVSLAGCANWLRSFGRQEADLAPEPQEALVWPWLGEWSGSMGRVQGLRPCGALEGVPLDWRHGACRLGDHLPQWA